jgi:hypothetical protein
MANIGTLEVGLKLNKADFDAALQKAKSDLAGLSGTTLKFNIQADASRLNELKGQLADISVAYQRLQTQFAAPLTIKVDDSALTRLNEHLELKRTHFREIQNYFNSSPLTIKIDDSNLSRLNAGFVKISQEFKKLKGDSEGQTIDVKYRVIQPNNLPGTGYNQPKLTGSNNQELHQQAQAIEKTVTPISSKGAQAQLAGSALTVEIAKGMQLAQPKLLQAASALGNTTESAIAQIANPQKSIGLFERLGNYLADGLGTGLGKGLKTVASIQFISILTQPIVMAGAAIAGAFGAMVSGSFGAAVGLEKLKIQLEGVYGSSAKASEQFKAFAASAKSYGGNAPQLARTAAELRLQTTGTSLEPQSERITSALDKIGVARGLDKDSRTQVADLIEKIAENPTLESRVISKALPKILPGALGIAARSQGISQAQFLALAKSGSVSTEQFLPQFARQSELEAQGNLANIQSSPLAQIDQVQTKLAVFSRNLGSPVLAAVGAVLAPINSLLDASAKLNGIFEALAGVISGRLILSLLQSNPLVMALQSGFTGLFAQLSSNPIGTVSVGFNNLAGSLKTAGLAFAELAVQAGLAFVAFKTVEAGYQVLFAQDDEMRKRAEYAQGLTQKASAQANKTGEEYKPTFTGNAYTDLQQNQKQITKNLLGNFLNPLKAGENISTVFSSIGNLINTPSQERDVANAQKFNTGTQAFLNSPEFTKYTNASYMAQKFKELQDIRGTSANLQAQAGYAQRTGNFDQYSKLNSALGTNQIKEQDFLKKNFDLAQLTTLQNNLKNQATAIDQSKQDGPIKAENLKKVNSELALVEKTINSINKLTNNTNTEWLGLTNTINKAQQSVDNINYSNSRQTLANQTNILQGQISGQYNSQVAGLYSAQSERGLLQGKSDVLQANLEKLTQGLQASLAARASGSNLTNAQEIARPERLGTDLLSGIQSGKLSPAAINSELEKNGLSYTPEQQKLLKTAAELAQFKDQYLESLKGIKEKDLQILQVQAEINKAAIQRQTALIESLNAMAQAKADISKTSALSGLNQAVANRSLGTVQYGVQSAQINQVAANSNLSSATTFVQSLGQALDKFDPATIEKFKEFIGLPVSSNLKNSLANTSRQALDLRLQNLTPAQQQQMANNGQLSGLASRAQAYTGANESQRQAGLQSAEASKAVLDSQMAAAETFISISRQLRNLGESFQGFQRALTKNILDAQNALKDAQNDLQLNQLKGQLQSFIIPGSNGPFRELFKIITDYEAEVNSIKSGQGKLQSDKLSIQDQTIQLSQQIRNLEEQRLDLSRQLVKDFGTNAEAIISAWKSATTKLTGINQYTDKILETFKGVANKLSGKPTTAIDAKTNTGNFTALAPTMPSAPVFAKVPEEKQEGTIAYARSPYGYNLRDNRDMMAPGTREFLFNKYSSNTPDLSSSNQNPIEQGDFEQRPNYQYDEQTPNLAPIQPATQAMGGNGQIVLNTPQVNLPANSQISQLQGLKTQANAVQQKNQEQLMENAGQSLIDKLQGFINSQGKTIIQQQRQLAPGSKEEINYQQMLDKSSGVLTYQNQITEAARSTRLEYEQAAYALEDQNKELKQQSDVLSSRIEDLNFKLSNRDLSDEQRQKLKEALAIAQSSQGLMVQQIGVNDQRITGLRGVENNAAQTAQGRKQVESYVESTQALVNFQVQYAKFKSDTGQDPFGSMGEQAAILTAKMENLKRSFDLEESIAKMGGEATLGAGKIAELRQQMDQMNAQSLKDAKIAGNKYASGFQSGLKDMISGLAQDVDGYTKPLEIVANGIRKMFSGVTDEISNMMSKSITEWIFGAQSAVGSSIQNTAGLNTSGIFAGNGGSGIGSVIGSGVNLLSGLFGGMGGGFSTSGITSLGFYQGGLVGNYASGGAIGSLGAQAARALFAEQNASGTKPVLAALTPGEYVIPRDQVNSMLSANPKPYRLNNLANMSAYSGIDTGNNGSTVTTNNRSYAVSNNWNINYNPSNPNSMSDSQVRAYNQMQTERTVKRFGDA